MQTMWMRRWTLCWAVTLVACSPGTPAPRGAPSPPTWHDAGADAFVEAADASEEEAAAEAPDAEAGVEAEAQAPRCPDGMVYVEGSYCPDVAHTCLGYLDPPGRYHEYRCREYAPPRCAGPREEMAFCIDAREYTPPGHRLPAHFVSFLDAQRICGSQGKRVCLESEWNFACEGEKMLPYPYGLARDASICNADRTDLWDKGHRTLRDQRAPSGQYPGCVSPFGVYDLAGNVEEWVMRDDAPGKPAMKGAWWLPGRNHCRARQTFHNEVYKGIETGFRCCAEVLDGVEAHEDRAVDEPPRRPPPPGCVDFRTAPGPDGGVDCYPYRCRDGRCLKRCKSMADCAGAQHPGDIAVEGWPLECHGRCVPMAREKVHP